MTSMIRHFTVPILVLLSWAPPTIAAPSFDHLTSRQTLDTGVNADPLDSGYGLSVASPPALKEYPNCEGSSMCAAIIADIGRHPQSSDGFQSFIPNNRYPLYQLGQHILPTMPANDTYYEGQQIACVTHKWALWSRWPLDAHVCLLLQGDGVPPEGVTVARIRELWQGLWGIGCKACGSIGVSGSWEQDAKGMLTANYVLRPGCEGACTPPVQRSGA